MRVIQFKAENFMKLKAVDIEVDEDQHVVELSGANGAGKSAVLKGLRYAIQGRRGAPEQVIRTGEGKAKVLADLGDLIITRTETGKTHTLKVMRKEQVNGETIVSNLATPQKVLDRFKEHVALDPAAFVNMRPKDQVATLKRLTGLDTAELDAQIAEAETARTQANRDAQRAQGAQADAETRLPPKPESMTPVDVSELLAELNSARAHNAAGEAQAQTVKDLESDLEHIKERYNDAATYRQELEARHQAEREQLLRRHTESMEQATEQVERRTAEGKAQLILVKEAKAAADRYQPVDTDPIEARLTSAEHVNTAIAAHENYRQLVQHAQDEERNARLAQEHLDGLRTQRQQMMSAAELPIEDLDYTDEGVFYQGVPLEQASSAEKIDVGFAIVTALNPRLKVVFIENASLLDPTMRERIRQRAEESSFDVWEEIVDTSGEVGFYLEDGTVKAVDGAPVPEADAQSPAEPEGTAAP